MDVALYFLSVGKNSNKPITNLKLQKLVYYAQVWNLVLHNEKLFDEPIEAWMHGPAVPSLYKRFKVFQFNPIEIGDIDISMLPFSNDQKKVLDNIWEVYGKYDPKYLEALTHSEIPWQSARMGLEQEDASHNVINLDLAKDYYARKLKSTERTDSKIK